MLLFQLILGGFLNLMIHHLIQGTEEDCRMLMSDCQVNVKKENVEQKKEARQSMERSNNEEAAVVQLDLSLDAYLPPGPRQADTLVMASRRFAQTPVLMTFLFLFLGVKVMTMKFNLEILVVSGVVDRSVNLSGRWRT